MILKHLTKDAPIGQIIKELDESGAVIIDSFLAKNDLNDSLNGYFTAAKTSYGPFWGYKTKRFGALPAKSSLCAELLIDNLILDIAKRVLSENGDTDIQINLTQAIEIMPDEKPQIIHRDDQLFPIASERELMLNFIFAVDDFTKENGATRIVPKSHKWDRERLPEPNDIIQACMKAGSCMIYRGSLLHAGGKNLSKRSRRAIVLSYNLGFLRQSENLMLSIPWEKACELPRQLQRLLGYQICKPNVGWVEGIEPLDWITLGRPKLSAAQNSLTPEQTMMIEELRNSPQHESYFG